MSVLPEIWLVFRKRETNYIAAILAEYGAVIKTFTEKNSQPFHPQDFIYVFYWKKTGSKILLFLFVIS